MLGFRILEPGLMTTCQDKGRLGFQDQGMPISGAMDQENMILANKLVGKSHDAVLEMTFMGAKIEFLKSMAIAITGADMQAALNNHAVNMYETIFVKAGDILSFKGLQAGFRSYLGLSDTLDVESLYGSKSTYTKINAGGYKGRAFKKGDEVQVFENTFHKKYTIAPPLREDPIRVMFSYEYDSFVNKEAFIEGTYEVTNELDRMGIRLKGPKLQHRDSPDIISSPIVPGAIQVAKNGQPMIMMRDAQTIGGYTRIGCVISPDLDKLAQKKPGDMVRFQVVSLDEAVEIKKAWLKRLESVNLCDEKRTFKIRVNHKEFEVVVREG